MATSGGYIVEYQSASSDINQSIAAKLTVRLRAIAADDAEALERDADRRT